MDRPARRTGLIAILLVSMLSVTWIASAPTVATASPSTVRHESTPPGAPARDAGTGSLPTSVRTMLQHRLPDEMRPAKRNPALPSASDDRSSDTVHVAANWSGEVHLGANLTSVSGTWKVPSIVPSSTLQFAATWIGIGGFTGTTLIQTGTIEVTAKGEVGYAAWVEVLPESAWTLTSLSTPGGTPSLAVAPGDVLRASVTLISTNEWKITIADMTANWSYTHTFRYSVKTTSAEWITERPTIYTTAAHKTVLATLADYGSTRFDDLSSSAGGGASGPPGSLTPVRMESGGDVISAPGPLSAAASSTGGTFTDSYLSVPARVFGATADGTAAAALEHQFTFRVGVCPSSPTSGRAVVLATDRTYPDALASAYLASFLATGTLLTSPTSLSATTLEALRDEGITHVYVVGGPLAVSTSVVFELEDASAYTCGGASVVPGTAKVQVTRVAGTTALDTALDIAETPGAAAGRVDVAGAYAGVDESGGDGTYNATAGSASRSAPSGPLTTAILATGAGFQDAEAASALSYADHLPVLLTAPSTLSPQALTALEALHVQQVIVMGGELAVSDAVVSSLEAEGLSVLRVAGADDTETAIELARLELAPSPQYEGLGWVGTGALTVARGDFYSDGLAGAILAADGPSDAEPEPLLLTASPTSMGSYLPAFLAAAGITGLGGKRVTTFTILGGPLAVSQSVTNTMVVALLGL